MTTFTPGTIQSKVNYLDLIFTSTLILTLIICRVHLKFRTFRVPRGSDSDSVTWTRNGRRKTDPRHRLPDT